MKALSTERGARYQTALKMKDALEGLTRLGRIGEGLGARCRSRGKR